MKPASILFAFSCFIVGGFACPQPLTVTASLGLLIAAATLAWAIAE
jgi:hypothetical protein